jgi:hypothetical protein
MSQLAFHTRRAIRRSLKLGCSLSFILATASLFGDPLFIGAAVGVPLLSITCGFLATSFWRWWLVVLGIVIASVGLMAFCWLGTLLVSGPSHGFTWAEALFTSGAACPLCLLTGTWGYAEGYYHRRRAEVCRGFCPDCGYSLVGLKDSLCPECGFKHNDDIDA